MRYTDIKDDEVLLEIKMSPGNLSAEAAKIDAKVGIEFEMIYPITEIGDSEPDYDYYEPEPDWDADESIDPRYSGWRRDLNSFFRHEGQNSLSDIDDAVNSLFEDFGEWCEERINRELNDGEHDDDLRDKISDMFDDEDVSDVEDDDDAREKFIDAAMSEGSDNRFYSQALDERRDELRDEYLGDGDLLNDFMDEENIDHYSSFADRYGLDWPYYQEPDFNQDGPSEDYRDLGSEFRRLIGRDVILNTEYGGDRAPNSWSIEPDGSLKARELSGTHTGLEFVSPELTLEEMLKDFKTITDWATEAGAVTGKEYGTGMHINVSVPGYNKNTLDYVKLAVLLGDHHVLATFGRLGNTYCESGLDKVRANIQRRPEDTKKLLDQMRTHLGQIASHAIHDTFTAKMTSINIKFNRIEFRSPGGDWLREYNGKVPETLLRFVVALDAACDPTKYRQEYLKKLYKLLTGTAVKTSVDPKTGKKQVMPVLEDNEVTQYFVNYIAGKLPRQDLQKFISKLRLERESARNKKEIWWEVRLVTMNSEPLEVVALNKQEAINKARETEPRWRNFYDHEFKVTALREYDPSQVSYVAFYRAGDSASELHHKFVTTDVGRDFDQAMMALRRSFLSKGHTEDTLDKIVVSAIKDRRTGNIMTNVGFFKRHDSPDVGGADANWEIHSRQTDRTMYTFAAPNEETANVMYNKWREIHDLSETDRSTYLVFRDRDSESAYTGFDRAPHTSIFQIVDDRDGEVLAAGETRTFAQAVDRANQLIRSREVPREDIRIFDLNDNKAYYITGAPVGSSSNNVGGEQSSDANYEIYNAETDQPVFRFIANTDEEARRKFRDWIDSSGRSPAGFGWRRIPGGNGSTAEQIQSFRVSYTATHDDEVRNDTSTIQARNADSAMDVMRTNLQRAGYEVLRIEAEPVNRENPVQRMPEFTGRWQIRDVNDNLVHTFDGDTSQSSANEYARRWVSTQQSMSRHMDLEGPITVVPEMR
jgi:hypothetical protein